MLGNLLKAFILSTGYFISSFLSFYGVSFKEALSLSILTLTNTVISNFYYLDNFDAKAFISLSTIKLNNKSFRII